MIMPFIHCQRLQDWFHGDALIPYKKTVITRRMALIDSSEDVPKINQIDCSLVRNSSNYRLVAIERP